MVAQWGHTLAVFNQMQVVLRAFVFAQDQSCSRSVGFESFPVLKPYDHGQTPERKSRRNATWRGVTLSDQRSAEETTGTARGTLYREGREEAEGSSLLLSDLNVKESSGEMLGGSQNPNTRVVNQFLESILHLQMHLLCASSEFISSLCFLGWCKSLYCGLLFCF